MSRNQIRGKLLLSRKLRYQKCSLPLRVSVRNIYICGHIKFTGLIKLTWFEDYHGRKLPVKYILLKFCNFEKWVKQCNNSFAPHETSIIWAYKQRIIATLLAPLMLRSCVKFCEIGCRKHCSVMFRWVGILVMAKQLDLQEASNTFNGALKKNNFNKHCSWLNDSCFR